MTQEQAKKLIEKAKKSQLTEEEKASLLEFASNEIQEVKDLVNKIIHNQ